MPSETPPLCQPCIDYGQKCTYDRPQGRRGAPPKNAPLQPAPPSIRASITSERIATTNIDLDTTLQLAEVYRMTVYPVYCFFHWPTFINYVKARHQDNDRSFQASVLAVCAVAAARLRDGACNELLKVWSPPSSQSDSSAITDIAILSNVHGLRSAALSSISSRASISEPNSTI